MISDTLHDAVLELRSYLADDILSRAYEGDIRKRIEALVDEMDAVRHLLDMPQNSDRPRYTEASQFIWGRHPDGVELTILDEDTGSAVAGQSIVLTWKELREVAAVLAVFGPQGV